MLVSGTGQEEGDRREGALGCDVQTQYMLLGMVQGCHLQRDPRPCTDDTKRGWPGCARDSCGRC